MGPSDGAEPTPGGSNTSTGGSANTPTVGSAGVLGTPTDISGPAALTNPNSAQTPLPPGPPAPPPTGLAAYSIVGRGAPTADGLALQFAYPNSSVGARFTGTSLGVRLSDTNTDVWQVVIDGGKPLLVTSQQGGQNRLYPIAPGLTPALAAGSHTVWLTKRTEFYQNGGGAAVGVTTFHGLELGADGVFASPPAGSARRMTFIGDSSITGYGSGGLMHGASDNCYYTPTNQNACASLPAYTASLFGADLHNTSWSGMAIYKSGYDDNPNHTLVHEYQEILPPSPAPAWNFAAFVSDVVVISGGGDDLVGAPGSGALPEPAAFVAAYVDLIARIRASAAKALIVCVVPSGATGTDATVLTSAINQAVAQSKDTNTFFYASFPGSPAYADYADAATKLQLYWGCNYHPSDAGALFLAQRLARFIASKNGWALSP